MKANVILSTLFSVLLVAQDAYGQTPVPKQTQTLRLLTGTAGGIFDPLGRAYAEIISKNMVGITATSEVTKGSVSNIHTLGKKEAPIAMVQADVAWEGYKGYGEFRNAQVPLRTLFVLYPNNLQLIATQQSGIRTTKDLRGKRVSTNSPGTGSEIWALRLLAADNLDPDKDIQRAKLNLVDSVAAVKAGKLDAFFFSGGAPAKAIAELSKEIPGGVRVIDTAHAIAPMLRKHGPVYTTGIIPANTYVGQPSHIRVADVWNMIVVREDMDETMAYNLVKTFFEHKDQIEDRPDFAAISRVLKQVSLSNQASSSPIPFHSGAAKYFTERGIRIRR